jgi:pyruvate/2-oxoglutarate dehydrogenase complex dihydrolipoamide acyltransferase (E2) component
MAFEVQEEGYIAKILAEAGKEITVGTPILITVESADDIKAFEKYEVVATATPAAAAAPAASQPAPTPTPAPAPVVSAPTPAPASVVTAPTPSPAPVIATPSAAPAPSNMNSSEPTFLYSKSWNKKTVSVLAPKIRAEHAAYLAKFGRTGHKSI